MGPSPHSDFCNATSVQPRLQATTPLPLPRVEGVPLRSKSRPGVKVALWTHQSCNQMADRRELLMATLWQRM